MNTYDSVYYRDYLRTALEFAAQFQSASECKTRLGGSEPLRSDQDVAQGMLQLQLQLIALKAFRQFREQLKCDLQMGAGFSKREPFAG